MDWSRAKSILILVFFILNIFLLICIGMYRSDQGASNTVSAALEVLKQRGVSVSTGIPEYRGNARVLVYGDGRDDMLLLKEKLQASAEKAGIRQASLEITLTNGCVLEYKNMDPADKVDLSDENSVKKYITGFIRKLGIDMSSYLLDYYSLVSDDTVELVFIEKYKDFMVYGNKLTARAGTAGITYLKYEHRKIERFSSEETKLVMPVHLVLLKNFDDSRKAEIVKIDLGFEGAAAIDQEMKASSEGPVWRIIWKEGNKTFESYFQAVDGRKMR
jgi:regulatory protein YycI of two-component signal transduction system YycFG